MENGYYWCRHPEGDQFIAFCHDREWWVPGVGHSVMINPAHVLWPVAAPGVFGSPTLEVDHRIN